MGHVGQVGHVGQGQVNENISHGYKPSKQTRSKPWRSEIKFLI
ncbi:hypothetical protein pah_c197o104 [Parachlamydia acanthamoebae str. Hall's coccus]|nr:hypothetical protein pah_c197o104 [Parachlamydia acanthamoebae str. Hall's coccus]